MVTIGMGMRPIALWVFMAIALQTCASYAGLFVRSVSSDGGNGLDVQNCMVKTKKINRFAKTAYHADCASKHIQLRPQPRRRR